MQPLQKIQRLYFSDFGADSVDVTLRSLIAFLLGILVAASAFALDPAIGISHYGHRSWRADDGLPQSAVQAIAQTPDGYLWIGTQYGVTRFDGSRLTTYNDALSPVRNVWVSAMVTDARGTLWLATASSGLFTLHKGAFRLASGRRELGAGDIFSIAAGPDDAIWLATGGGVVQRSRNGAIRRWSEAEGLPNPQVRALLFDRAGDLWIGTEGGLARMSRGRVIRETAVPPHAVRSLAQDSRGRIWVGTTLGVYCLEHGKARRIAALRDIDDAFVTSIREDAHQNLWFGTNAGLKRLTADGVSEMSPKDSLTGRFVLSLFEDRDRNLWVGTFTGLDQLRETPFISYGVRHGLRDEGVFSVVQDRSGAIWFGTIGGLGRLRDGTLRWFTRAEGLSNDTVISLAPARGGGVWAGTYGGGVCHVDEGRPRCRGSMGGLSHGVVSALHEDPDGGLWLGTIGGGLNHVRDGKVTVFGEREGIRSRRIGTITPARGGGLWLGMLGGGVALFRDGRVVREVNILAVPPSVRSIVEDADGSLWIAMDNRGLALVKNGRVTLFPLAPHVIDTSLHHILDDGAGVFWLTFHRDLVRIAKADLLRYAGGDASPLQPMVFRGNGLESTEFSTGQPNGIRAADGTLWFNGKKGASHVDPRALGRRTAARPWARIELVTADGQPLTRESPAIDARVKHLAFRFTSINFDTPKQLTFRYRLEGYDRAWIDGGPSRIAVYTRLAPGSYTFRVVAAGADGVWNEAGAAELRFTRTARFHETIPFYVVCAIATAITGGLVVRWRMRAIRRLLRERVRRQTARLRLILSTAGEGIFGLDAAGVTMFINPSAARMLGWSERELVGRPLHDVIHALPDLPFADCPLCSTFVNPPVRISRTDAFRKRDDTTIPVEYTSSSMVTDHGARTGVVITFRDISERQAMERMKSEFVSTVSHELRTPLTSIRGALGLLGSGKLGELVPRGQRMLEIAVSNTDRLMRLINDILDVERIESGQVEANRKLIDARDVMIQSAEVVQTMADRAGVQLAVVPVHAMLWVDADRIIQLLTNLLSNAIKFSPRGSTVTLSAVADGSEARFRVADEGRGIPGDKLESIFERFQQVDASDSRDKGGTGLGLAICRSIASAHAGRIWAESTAGAGSVFHVVLAQQKDVLDAA